MTTRLRSAPFRVEGRTFVPTDEQPPAASGLSRLVQVALALYLIPALLIVLVVGGCGIVILAVARVVTAIMWGPDRWPSHPLDRYHPLHPICASTTATPEPKPEGRLNQRISRACAAIVPPESRDVRLRYHERTRIAADLDQPGPHGSFCGSSAGDVETGFVSTVLPTSEWDIRSLISRASSPRSSSVGPYTSSLGTETGRSRRILNMAG